MGLHPTLAAIKRNLPRVARELGFSARVTSGYRSTKKQAWLYDRYLRGLQEYPVAPPGTSDHERGLALDVVSTDPDKLVALLTKVGLSWAGPSDPVHFALIKPPSAKKGAKTQKSVDIWWYDIKHKKLRKATPEEYAVLVKMDKTTRDYVTNAPPTGIAKTLENVFMAGGRALVDILFPK